MKKNHRMIELNQPRVIFVSNSFGSSNARMTNTSTDSAPRDSAKEIAHAFVTILSPATADQGRVANTDNGSAVQFLRPLEDDILFFSHLLTATIKEHSGVAGGTPRKSLCIPADSRRL